MFKNILKAVVGVVGAGLFLLVITKASDALFTLKAQPTGENVVAMTAAPGGAGGDAAPVEEEVAVVLGAGDAAKGEKVFGKCKACHKVDGTNATGPHLDGVVGRAVGAVADFAYSDGVKAHGGVWTIEMLDAWLAKPKDYIPGNKMAFAGLPKDEDRYNVIAYLQSISQ